MSARGDFDPLAGWLSDQTQRLDASARRARLAGLIMAVLALAILAAVLAGCRA
ncbi:MULTISPECIES: hypothetical protein [Alphaproteobacteria]|uniref:hypothetical protein n=1 Tax=Alphaproteobacteria TaxID=28211 RepID=UPI003A8EA85D